MLPNTIQYKYIKYDGYVYMKVDTIPTDDIEDVLYSPEVDMTEEGKSKQIKKAGDRISKIISGQPNII